MKDLISKIPGIEGRSARSLNQTWACMPVSLAVSALRLATRRTAPCGLIIFNLTQSDRIEMVILDTSLDESVELAASEIARKYGSGKARSRIAFFAAS